MADQDDLMAELGHMQEELELQRAAFEKQCASEHAAERAEQEAMTREDRERRSAAERPVSPKAGVIFAAGESSPPRPFGRGHRAQARRT